MDELYTLCQKYSWTVSVIFDRLDEQHRLKPLLQKLMNVRLNARPLPRQIGLAPLADDQIVTDLEGEMVEYLSSAISIMENFTEMQSDRLARDISWAELTFYEELQQRKLDGVLNCETIIGTIVVNNLFIHREFHAIFSIISHENYSSEVLDAASTLERVFSEWRQNGTVGAEDARSCQTAIARLTGLNSSRQEDQHSVGQFLRMAADMFDPEFKKKVGTWTQRVSAASEAPPLPTVAPALWKDDKQPEDTPISFIERHYKPWLGRGLSRPDIRHLDKSLYAGLANWLRNNELPDGFELPTRAQVTDSLLSADAISPEHAKRVSNAREWRNIKQRTS